MLQRQPRWLVLLEALVLILLIGWFDYATGWEWSFFAPYALPIMVVVWKAGWRIGLLYSSLCAVMFLASHLQENPYHTSWAFALAVFGWWFYFSILVVAIASLKYHRDRDRAQIKSLEYSRGLEHEILHVSEEEQQRIGRDLHDGLGPHLAAITYAAAFLENELHQHGQQEAGQAGRIREMAGSAALLAQDLARGLIVVPMEGSGLALALGEMARSTSCVTTTPVSFRETGDPRVEDPLLGIHLYRIAREAVNNSVKHSHAGKVTIDLSGTDGFLRLIVADDGCGMDLSNASHGKGLHSMRSRAHGFAGDFHIESSPGNGTIVSCKIPNLPLQIVAPSR